MTECGDTVFFVEEIVARVIAGSKIIRVFTCRFLKRRFCFHEPDVFPDLSRIDFLVQVAVWQEQGLSEIIEGSVAAGAFNCLLAATISVEDTFDTLSRDAVGIVHHFYKNEFTITIVSLDHVEDGVGGGTGTDEEVENKRFPVSSNIKNKLNKCNAVLFVETEEIMVKRNKEIINTHRWKLINCK